MELSPDMLLGALLTPTVIVGIVGWLLKRAITATDTSITNLQGEMKALGVAMGARDVNAARSEARLEARIEALERELFHSKS